MTRIDPVFEEYIVNTLSPVTVHSVHCDDCEGSLNGVRRTEFDITVPAGRCAAVLPLDNALFNVAVPVTGNLAVRSLVVQQNHVLLTATVEDTADGERMRGELFHGPDLFAIDALSEICADKSLKGIRRYVADTVAALVAPIAGADTGVEIARALAPKVSPAIGRRFAAGISSVMNHPDAPADGGANPANQTGERT